MEIERKYLVSALPEGLDRFPHSEIEQGYLCTQPTLRIRRYGDRCVLTVKEHLVSASNAIVNREEEFEMNPASYMHLRGKCDGRFVAKTRYRIPLQQMYPDGGYGNLVAELDCFHGRHEGRLLVPCGYQGLLVEKSN